MTSHADPKGAPHPHDSHLRALRSLRVRRVLLGALYLCALSVVVVWEYRERLEAHLSKGCELREEAKSGLYSQSYSRFLNWAESDAAGHVVMLAIPQDLEEVQGNLCLGRTYLADVLTALAAKNPAVVVVDKFFSAGACVSQPASTKSLLDAVRSLKTPVVIGESTTGLETKAAFACLMRKPQLDFDAPNVRHGLTRLNEEPERLPLQWIVAPQGSEEAPDHEAAREQAHPPEQHAAPPQTEYAESLSLAAVQAYDATFAARPSVQRLRGEYTDAYANLSIKLPRLTTTALLCASGDVSVLRRWSLECAGPAALPNMAGRIVLIGAESATDDREVLGKHIWGFELQAMYIETLLSGDYLRSLPLNVGFALFAIFIFVIEGLPTILLGTHPEWQKKMFVRHAYPARRYFWVAFWTTALIMGSTLACLALRYLPPLLVYGDILLVAVTRLLFFVAESAEHPFLHAHQHGKDHTLPDPTPPTDPPGTLPPPAPTDAVPPPASTDTVPTPAPADVVLPPDLPPGVIAIPDPDAPGGFDIVAPLIPAPPAPPSKTGNNPGTEGGTAG